MCPITHASYLSIITAVVASFVFGFLWYGPLFGKTWMQLAGITRKEGAPMPVWIFPVTILGTLMTTFVLALFMKKGKSPCAGSGIALLAWLGFYVPVLFGSVAWERKPWGLFLLNAAYYLLNLQLIAAVLTYVH